MLWSPLEGGHMKRISFAVLLVFLAVILSSLAYAQEQKPGQPLVFPKDQVKEHPSDLHMGSDPYYHKEKPKVEGSDEKGYPPEYDPGMQYYESSTTIKKVDKKKKKQEPDIIE